MFSPKLEVAHFLSDIMASQTLLLMFTTSRPLPHLQFVYSSDTSIFPEKRDKSVSLLWLLNAFTHHLLPQLSSGYYSG